ncbi:hypothetical protein [Acaryochloris sp. CCMEE 5410]|uniref:hypothetical protein n=1 Tax=Acaryochloris sp. CCMEE 5410 TaxID=310037 RepID=UPI0002484D8D|nr:hypothetical protein [Acaryochloris sp. CCMEE 5410]KAI9130562.1 hypothetical protein ON05_022510 [Acaryochloris sp. CCMEE 5410]
MSIDFCIACNDCYEYLELHKWFPDDDLSEKYPCDLKRGNYSGSPTNKNKVEKAIAIFETGLRQKCPGHWIENLVPYLQSFIEAHDGHSLSIYNDCGDMPWDFAEPDWHKWKEIRGPMSCWDENFKDVVLPRNMIDDLDISTWEDALTHYKNNCLDIIGPGIPNELKKIFKTHLESLK